MTELPENVDRLCSLRSCDWALQRQALLNRFVLALEWNGERESNRLSSPWVTIAFEFPTSRATVDYSRLWQHAPDHNEAAVLTIKEHANGSTHLDGLTLNLESWPEGWTSARICAQCDAIDVVSNGMPSILFHDNEPEIIAWWNSGFGYDT